MATDTKKRIEELVEESRQRLVEVDAEERALETEKNHLRLIIAACEGKATFKRSSKTAAEEGGEVAPAEKNGTPAEERVEEEPAAEPAMTDDERKPWMDRIEQAKTWGELDAIGSDMQKCGVSKDSHLGSYYNARSTALKQAKRR